MTGFKVKNVSFTMVLDSPFNHVCHNGYDHPGKDDYSYYVDKACNKHSQGTDLVTRAEIAECIVVD
jgi:hypothetical protein